MSDNLTAIDPDAVIARWPIGNVQTYTEAGDAWQTREVEAVFTPAGEYVHIGDVQLLSTDASRLAHLLLQALTTLQKNIVHRDLEVTD